jgi:hypothetical protein
MPKGNPAKDDTVSRGKMLRIGKERNRHRLASTPLELNLPGVLLASTGTGKEIIVVEAR